MSFDLIMRSRLEKDHLVKSLERWFSERPHYEVENGQAFYENEDTAVHFIFEFGGEPYFEGSDEHDVVFLLNYNRPSPFVLQAADELDPLIDAFGFTVMDPQLEEADLRPWSREAFVSSYLDHAEKSFRTVFSKAYADEGIAVTYAPSALLTKVWQWNNGKARLRDWLSDQGRDVFVPTAAIISHRGETTSAIVWTDDVPTAMPAFDYVLHFRYEMAPRKFFGLGPRRRSYELLPRTEILALLQKHYSTRSEFPGVLFPNEDDSAALRDAIGFDRLSDNSQIFYGDKLNLISDPDAPRTIAFDEVIDREFIE
ncbi:MAG: hypothetical protein AAGI13_08170 [Pseudomonadota bacterium]